MVSQEGCGAGRGATAEDETTIVSPSKHRRSYDALDVPLAVLGTTARAARYLAPSTVAGLTLSAADFFFGGWTPSSGRLMPERIALWYSSMSSE